MTLNFQTEAAIRQLCENLPKAIEKLAEATSRREPIVLLVPANITSEQMSRLGKMLAEALRGD